MNKKILMSIKTEISEIETPNKSIILGKIANKYYKQTPSNDYDLLKLCEQLFLTHDFNYFSIATLWIKKRKTTIDIQYFPIIEKWMNCYIDSWWTCDQFCYRVLNPFVDKYLQLFDNILVWANSDKTYIRRAAAVSLIRCGNGIRVKYDIDKIFIITDILRKDKDLHIQKSVGWLLKYSYEAYPSQILDYLKENVSILSRTTFRDALEKVPKNVKKEMMKL